jgi:hypothetical protein
MLNSDQILDDNRFFSRLFAAEAAQKILAECPETTATELVEALTLKLQLMWIQDADHQEHLSRVPGLVELVEKLLSWKADQE